MDVKEFQASLPKFNKNINCKKCNGHKAKILFVDDEDKGEYLQRKCIVCGYIWNEKCKDMP